MFLVIPELTWKEACLSTFLPSKTNEIHLGGFNFRSRSLHECEICCIAALWSSLEEETIVMSSAKPFTLCGLDVPAVWLSGLLLKGRNHLSVPRVGHHLISSNFTTSVNQPFLYIRLAVPSWLINVTLARYHPCGSSESGSFHKAYTYELTSGGLGAPFGESPHVGSE